MPCGGEAHRAPAATLAVFGAMSMATLAGMTGLTPEVRHFITEVLRVP